MPLRSIATPSGMVTAPSAGQLERERRVVGRDQHRVDRVRRDAGGHRVEGEGGGEGATRRRRPARPAATCRARVASPGPARRTSASAPSFQQLRSRFGRVAGGGTTSLSRVKVRHLQEGRRGWAWSIAVPIVRPILLATTKHKWIDGEKIPAEGGFILVINHISEVDPLIVAHIVWDHGRLPRYLAKAGLFKNKFLGFFLRVGRADPGRPRVEERRRRLRRRGRRGAGRQVRRGLPRGHDHPRPGPVADGRQVRRRAHRAGHRARR